MATLVLGAAGSAVGAFFGGPLGAAGGKFVGGAAGAYVDQRYLLPLLQPKAETEGLESLTPQSADEGAPISLCLGRLARTQGVVAWFDEIKTDDDGALQKGSAAGQSTAPAVEYRRSILLAYHFDRYARPGRVLRIIAEGKTIYRTEDDVQVGTDDVSVTREEHQRHDGSSWIIEDVWMRILAPSGTADLTGFESGVDVSVSGFSNGGNNGTFRCMGVETNTSNGDQTLILRNTGCVTEAVSGSTKTISQVLPDAPKRWYSAIRFYDGAADQLPDPLVESVEGSNIPALRGYAYVVIEDMKITEWGGRVPQMNVIVQERNDRSNASGLALLMRRAGMRPGDYDLSGVTGEMSGLAIHGRSSVGQQLAQLLVSNDITVRESNGKLQFMQRSSMAQVSRGELVSPIEKSRSQTDRVPSRLLFRFADTTNDAQPGEEPAADPSGDGDVEEEINVDVTMTPAQAAVVAHRLLFQRIANSRTRKLELGPGDLGLRVGDIIDGRWMIINRVVRSDRNVQVTVAFEWPDDGWPATSGQGRPVQYLELDHPAEHRLIAWDGGPLRDQEVGRMGYYAAHAVIDERVVEPRGQIFTGTSATTARAQLTIGREAVLGRVAVVPSTSVDPAFWDMISQPEVSIYEGVLESATSDHEVASGERNWAMLGNEIVGFVYADLIGHKRYRLRRLLRGLRATEWWVGSHVVGEPFMLISEERMKYKSDGAVVGSTQYRMAIAANARRDDHLAFPSLVRGGGERPFPPTAIRAMRNSTTQLVDLVWTRRDPGTAPPIPGPLPTRGRTTWEITIGTLVDQPSFGTNQALRTQYTYAQLTAAGVTPSASFDVTMRQVGNSGTFSDPITVTT